MTEAVAILSAIAGDWNDSTIVIARLLFNALIDFTAGHL